MSRGHNRERDVRKLLELDGWVCIRAAGSLGPVDVVAVRRVSRLDPYGPSYVLFVEVKSTAGGPWERFGPKSRAALLDVAARAGARAALAWWPPNSKLRWIDAADWPPPRSGRPAPVLPRSGVPL